MKKIKKGKKAEIDFNWNASYVRNKLEKMVSTDKRSKSGLPFDLIYV